ncbi:tripartite tricarboxylate transporter substrate binding protein [Cupriavidus basilensis]|uniref:Tripartite tricarboxylate transporter substrate binding protein n=1 Tax=Cupriavidus basilensis TaxID=68895 RepID=A0ABT6B079_9BURK|nr:tripartite tricarboxylate transporter substrate binding protein [Cupriavidus basilensis]MDF3838149.1 tripartite tricarboxylate transporter substrate binding protein [Cupriavidus basilensis]
MTTRTLNKTGGMARYIAAGIGAGLVMAASMPALAGSFPDKPVKLVVPFPPGGSTDVLGRLLARKLGEVLQQSVVVENRAGAGTIVGADYVAKSAPDGYTLLFSAATTFTVNPVTYARLPYDPLKSFEPLGMVGSTALVLLANPAVKADTLKQLVSEAKATPGGMSYGSYGAGTTAHFAGEMINAATGMGLLHVPYKGSAPAMADLIGNQIPLSVDTVVAAAPQLKGGKVKAIAVTSATRSKLLPQVPTAIESGFPGVSLSTWFAVVAPKGIPAPVRQTLESAIANMMKDPALQQSMTANGFEPEYGSAGEYRARVTSELVRLRKIAQAANIHAD